jgi:hypothetical protein
MKNSCVETTQTLISKLQRWISWAWNYDGPWFYVFSILVEP